MKDELKEGLTNVGETGGTKTGSQGNITESGGTNTGSDSGGSGKNSGRKTTSRNVGKETRPVTDNSMETGRNVGQTGTEIGNSEGSSDGNGGGSEGSSAGSSGSAAGSGNNGETNHKGVSQKSASIKPKDVRPTRTTGKTKEVKKDTGEITDADTLATIIQSGFSLIAGITNRQHWNVSETEAITIAKPASAMIQKLTAAQKKKINQLAAPIILGSAIASVIVPRLIIDMTMAKGVKTHGQKQVNTIQSGNRIPTTIEPGNTEYKGNPVHTSPAGIGNNEEIAGLFNSLDSATGLGTVGI